MSEHTSVSRDAVIWGYRLFLDREPENPQVIEEKVRSCSSAQELRKDFLTSEEFRRKNLPVHTTALSGDEPRMVIEEVRSEHDLQRLLAHVQDAWHYLGETEPYWSVVISEQFRQSNIQNVREEFYGSGKHDVIRLCRTLERNGIDPNSFRSCLEYGCGLGRVTRWLAERFEKVYGYDISLSHLQSAQHYLLGENISNVTLRHVTSIQDIHNLPKIDLIYSVIVLQHNPPPIIRMIVEAFVKALNPGGVALFQVPTYRLGYSFSLEQYLRNEATRREMEMHVLPQSTIFRLVQREGGQIIEVLEDGSTGLRYKEVSNTFLIKKPSA